jgi:hypothetical protein
VNDGLLAWLYQVNWRQYWRYLNSLIGVLGYPFCIVGDWRFSALKRRANWLLENRRFPTVAEAFGNEWQQFIGKEIWKIEWEIENLGIK